MVFLLYSGTIQPHAERDLKLTRLLAIISSYLAKFMKHNKSKTAFLHEIVIFFLQSIYQLWLMWLAHSNLIGQNSDGGISDFRISGQPLKKENCHNSKTRQEKQNNVKNFNNDVMSANCDVIAIFPI